MGLFIRDDILQQTDITERDAFIEFVCRLHDSGRLLIFQARQLAGIDSRAERESELIKRGLPLVKPTPQDLQEDIRNLDSLLGTPAP